MLESYYTSYIRSLIAGAILSLSSVGVAQALDLQIDNSARASDQNKGATKTPSNKEALDQKEASVQKMISQGERLLGRRYRTSGVAPWPLDCSGYVSYLYSKIGLSLPRSSASMATVVKKVADPEPGDLVFFKGRNAGSSRVGHVALVVENNGGDLVIMHSTNSRGIIKHRLGSSAYFSKRYLYAGRVEALGGKDEPRLCQIPQANTGEVYPGSHLLDRGIREVLKPVRSSSKK